MNPNELQQVGPYPVKSFIAEGGMAWVFEVVDPRFDARRALKMLKPAAAQGEEFRRFEAEARLLAQIDHPNLITIFDFGKDDESGCYYYTMTFVDGPSLNTMGRLSPEVCGPIFLNVLSGLARLHSAGIVHRDIKPANVMLTADHRALLGDLGIARAAEQSGGLTRTGTAIGTCLYMSPEQARGKQVGPQSDVFSMGLSLYEVLTGSTVYDNVDDVDTTSGQEILLYLGSLIHTGGELAIQFPDDMPAPLRAVIERACTFDPEKRYADASEMHDALRDALRSPDAVPKKPLPLVPIAAGVAGLAAVAAGAFFVLRPTPVDLGGVRDDVAALERSAIRVVESLAGFNPGPSVILLSDSKRELEVASTFYQRGQEALEGGDDSGANASLELAGQGYERACDQIVTQFMQSRSDVAAKQAIERADGLRAVSADKLSPEKWQQLEGLLAGLSTPIAGDSTCANAEAHLERLDQSGRAAALALVVQQDVSTEWPLLAAAAEASAAEAQTAATAVEVDAPEFLLAYSTGIDELETGRAAVELEHYLEAQDGFRRAQGAFREAELIGPAARGRAEVSRLEREAMSRGIENFGIVSRIVSEAESLYRAGEWEDSALSYAQGAKLFGNLFEDAEQSGLANTAAANADSLRVEALKVGADKVAQVEMGQGDELRAEAIKLLSSKRYDESEAEFAKAAKRYAAARGSARTALADARGSGDLARSALSSLGSCDKLAATAKSQCDTARADLVAGDAAIKHADARTALARYGSAEEGFKRAGQSQTDHIARLPKPPSRVRRTPVGKTAKIYRNETVALAIEASDPNGDKLNYVWSADGKRLPESGSAIKFNPDSSSRVSVVVDDGTGLSFEETWRVDVVNRKPKLTLSPSDKEIRLEIGQPVAFKATANDPDGDPVTIDYYVNDKKVSRGGSYSFSSKRPGRYVILARAEDGAGGKLAYQRMVTVAAKNVPKPAPVAKIPTPSESAPGKIGPGDPSVGARAGLEEYRLAWETRDVDRLGGVRSLDSRQRKSMRAYFGSTTSISMKLEEKKVYDVSPDSVMIDFDQTVTTKGQKPQRTAYTARLARNGDRWVIADLKPR